MNKKTDKGTDKLPKSNGSLQILQSRDIITFFFYDIIMHSVVLTLSAQTKTDILKTVKIQMSRLIRIFTVCHYVFEFKVKPSPLFASVEMSKFKNGSVYFRNAEMKGLKWQRINNNKRFEKVAFLYEIDLLKFHFMSTM